MAWRMIKAILIILCWRLMITSDPRREWNVPVMNLLIKTSSIAVSEGRSPSTIVAKRKCLRIQLKVKSLTTYKCSTSSMTSCGRWNEVDWPFHKSMVDLFLGLYDIFLTGPLDLLLLLQCIFGWWLFALSRIWTEIDQKLVIFYFEVFLNQLVYLSISIIQLIHTLFWNVILILK